MFLDEKNVFRPQFIVNNCLQFLAIRSFICYSFTFEIKILEINKPRTELELLLSTDLDLSSLENNTSFIRNLMMMNRGQN